MSIAVKTAQEIAALRQGGKILARTLAVVAAAVRPGLSTQELANIAARELKAAGARPSFLGYGDPSNQFPAALCTSVNSAVVHGIPSAHVVLREGDIIGLDLGCWYQGLCTDMAVTVPVGQVSPQAQKFIRVTRQALELAIKQVRAGVKTGDIGHAVQAFVEANGFSVVRQLTGHGVGHAVHEDPSVPNFGRPGTGSTLPAGAVIALEPMVNVGGAAVKFLGDGWSVVTADGSLSAHFEHTVVVTDKGYEILTVV